MDPAFTSAMEAGYRLDEPSVVIGGALHDGAVLGSPPVAVALSMLNRHGLVAGATGTGKTKTLQLLAGQLSKSGVPVFIADIKGDLTGLAAPGDATNARVVERMASLGLPFEPSGHPVEFLSLSGNLGAPVRMAAEAARVREERERRRTLETAIRTGGRVTTSRLGQDLLRGVFGTIFGGGRRR